MNTRIVILGAKESGTGAAILAKSKGLDVFVSDFGEIEPKYKQILDKHNIAWEENKHSEELILNAAEIIKSPGIPDTAKIIKKAKKQSISIISEIEFAGRYTNAKKICITGSNGKTTTTLLIHHVLKQAGLNVGLAGNVGQSFALQVAEKKIDYYVIELSSFQLDGMFKFKADIAILLNITPDHLDRYDYNMQKYIDSKFRITQNQTANDAFIYCIDDDKINKEVQKRKLKATLYPFTLEKIEQQIAYKDNNEIIINIHNQRLTMLVKDLALKGKHNAGNSMAAGIASKLLEIRNETIRECLADFKNVEHRLEFVAEINNIRFINDSKATNINSTWYALESMERPVVWIVGGVDKGNDYSELDELVDAKVKAIVCLGKDISKIIDAFQDRVPIAETRSMEQAVKAAYALSEPGSTVLLSPACASFDLFKSYEDRGTQFKNEVAKL